MANQQSSDISILSSSMQTSSLLASKDSKIDEPRSQIKPTESGKLKIFFSSNLSVLLNKNWNT